MRSTFAQSSVWESAAKVLPFVLCGLLSGCLEPVDQATDGGPDASVEQDAALLQPDAGSVWLPPLAPEPPRWNTCPEGWQALEGPPPTCEPWAFEERTTCADGEARFPGDSSCHRLGTLCPEGGFPEDLPADALYLRPGGTGTGSREAPFGDLQTAIEAAVEGQTLALSPGTFHLNRLIRKTLHFRGSCLETTIVGTPVLGADGITMSNLRLEGPDTALLVDSRAVVLHDMQLLGGLQMTPGSQVTASRMRIRGISVPALTASGELDMQDMQLEASLVGLHAGSEEVRGTDVVLITLPEEPGANAPVMVVSGGTLILRRFLIEGERSPTVIAPGGILDLQDAVLRGPERATRIPGAGILAAEGSSVRLERVLIERARVLGIAISDSAGLWARDLVIRDVLLGTDVARGYGLELSSGGTADLARVWLSGATSLGLVLTGVDAGLTMQDVLIADTQPNADGTFGRALQVQGGAMLTGVRVSLEDNYELSAVSVGEGSSLELSEVSILRTRARPCAADGCPAAGIGLGTYNAGRSRLTRFLVEGNALAGVQVAFGGQVDLLDGVIADNTIGVNIQQEGYDITRLNAEVVYRDNGVNLDSTALYIPEPSLP